LGTPALAEAPEGLRFLETNLSSIANSSPGNIGIAALDLKTGELVAVHGDQPFPMASTVKVAVAANYLAQVEAGQRDLDERISGATASQLMARMLIHSDNQATDALLAAVGGPQVVNRWVRDAGIAGFRLDRDIATLVRDDGQFDPARMVDLRDSATPLSMVRLVSGLYQGQWLTPASRQVLMSAMERCVTGKRRMRALLPADAQVLHKTGTLNNTSSDVGIINTPDGRAIAVAIYVTGQGGKPARDARIASIARVIYDGYQVEASSLRRTASR
jgi:beta-lactamase class A